MIRTFKVISALLSYPTGEIQRAAHEFLSVLEEEDLLPAPLQQSLARFIEELESGNLIDLQERYVLLFDRTRSLSLHLFEHVHGESRDRGQAMVDLRSLYEANGLTMDSTELPDYLPLFLEFLATLPMQRAIELLGEPAHVLAALADRLRKRESSYAAILEALGALAAPPDSAVMEALLEEVDDDPQDLDALDAAWETETVRFGPEAPRAACGKDLGMIKNVHRIDVSAVRRKGGSQ
jgi:nitrate reductase delta subunit